MKYRNKPHTCKYCTRNFVDFDCYQSHSRRHRASVDLFIQLPFFKKLRRLTSSKSRVEIVTVNSLDSEILSAKSEHGLGTEGCQFQECADDINTCLSLNCKKETEKVNNIMVYITTSPPVLTKETSREEHGVQDDIEPPTLYLPDDNDHTDSDSDDYTGYSDLQDGDDNINLSESPSDRQRPLQSINDGNREKSTEHSELSRSKRSRMHLAEIESSDTYDVENSFIDDQTGNLIDQLAEERQSCNSIDKDITNGTRSNNNNILNVSRDNVLEHSCHSHTPSNSVVENNSGNLMKTRTVSIVLHRNEINDIIKYNNAHIPSIPESSIEVAHFQSNNNMDIHLNEDNGNERAIADDTSTSSAASPERLTGDNNALTGKGSTLSKRSVRTKNALTIETSTPTERLLDGNETLSNESFSLPETLLNAIDAPRNKGCSTPTRSLDKNNALTNERTTTPERPLDVNIVTTNEKSNYPEGSSDVYKAPMNERNDSPGNALDALTNERGTSPESSSNADSALNIDMSNHVVKYNTSVPATITTALVPPAGVHDKEGLNIRMTSISIDFINSASTLDKLLNSNLRVELINYEVKEGSKKSASRPSFDNHQRARIKDGKRHIRARGRPKLSKTKQPGKSLKRKILEGKKLRTSNPSNDSTSLPPTNEDPSSNRRAQHRQFGIAGQNRQSPYTKGKHTQRNHTGILNSNETCQEKIGVFDEGDTSKDKTTMARPKVAIVRKTRGSVKRKEKEGQPPDENGIDGKNKVKELCNVDSGHLTDRVEQSVDVCGLKSVNARKKRKYAQGKRKRKDVLIEHKTFQVNESAGAETTSIPNQDNENLAHEKGQIKGDELIDGKRSRFVTTTREQQTADNGSTIDLRKEYFEKNKKGNHSKRKSTHKDLLNNNEKSQAYDRQAAKNQKKEDATSKANKGKQGPKNVNFGRKRKPTKRRSMRLQEEYRNNEEADGDTRSLLITNGDQQSTTQNHISHHAPKYKNIHKTEKKTKRKRKHRGSQTCGDDESASISQVRTIQDSKDGKSNENITKKRKYKKRPMGPLEGPVACTVCGKVFARYRSIANHMFCHVTESEKSHVCKYCNKRFARKHHLQNHEKTHTQERPAECPLCCKKFNQQNYLKAHLMIHSGKKPYTCELCNKRFSQKSQRQRHMMQVHSELRPYKCKQCGSGFKTPEILVVHGRTHSGNRPYKCCYCSMDYNSRTYLKIHYRSHTGERRYKCKVCGKAFVQGSHLKAHVAIHSDERPFKCDRPSCDKAFKLKTSLVSHWRAHSDERKYKCTQCPKKYKNHNGLRAHQRWHRGIKLYACTYCGRRFSYSTHRNTHERIHTGEKPFQCTICKEYFARREQRKRHLQLAHADGEIGKLRETSTT